MTTTRKFENARTLATNSLTYTGRGGQHIVTHRTAAGECVSPEVYRHATVEEARRTWAKLARQLQSRGYAQV